MFDPHTTSNEILRCTRQPICGNIGEGCRLIFSAGNVPLTTSDLYDLICIGYRVTAQQGAESWNVTPDTIISSLNDLKGYGLRPEYKVSVDLCFCMA